ncbi:MAG TPA: SUF system NifU family Fe-S cluster assembly protein [Candidatus Thermoplasmatota archaeon]
MTLDMYQENILEHYRNPHNKRKLDPAHVTQKENNPLCGDVLEVYVLFGADGKVAEVAFEGQGCAISQASMSMLTDELKGKAMDEVEAMGADAIQEMVVVPLSPVRMKCATLGIKAVQNGIAAYRVRHPGADAGPEAAGATSK